MEQVLVVERKALEERLCGRGFITREMEDICAFILQHHRFVPREPAEEDCTLKQIIPYVVISQNGQYFLMKRLTGQTELRLHHCYSLGVGGHINPQETPEEGQSILEAGLYRELREEVYVEDIASLRPIGILHENNGGVSDFHLGLVYLLEAQGEVFVRETEKMEGEFQDFSTIMSKFSELESWSQIVVSDYLQGLEGQR